MSRKTWITRDAQGNIVSSTEVHSSSSCAGCLWVVLGVFIVVGPAAWAANGEIPVAAAVLMYLVEAVLAVTALMQYVRRRMRRVRTGAPPPPGSPPPREPTPNSSTSPPEGEYDPGWEQRRH